MLLVWPLSLTRVTFRLWIATFLEVEKPGALLPCNCILCTAALWAPAFAQPGYAIFTAKVAVVNLNEIAYDPPCSRVYRQGRYSKAVDLIIYVADPAIGLRRPSKNKEMWTKKHYFSVELPKNVKSYELLGKRLVRPTTNRWRSSKKNTWSQYSYKKEQIQRPGTTFSNLSVKVAVPRGHENCYRLATL